MGDCTIVTNGACDYFDKNLNIFYNTFKCNTAHSQQTNNYMISTTPVVANTRATPDELSRVGNLIRDYFIETLVDKCFTSEQVEKILSDKTVLKTCVKQYTHTCLYLSSTDPFSIYCANLKKFFADVYRVDIPVDFIMKSSEEFEHYMIVPKGLDMYTIVQGYERVGLAKERLFDKKVLDKKSAQAYRPSETYFFCHKGGEEADLEHRGKSLSDIKEEGGTYMNIEEYMLVDQFMWWNFKILLDTKGWTLTTSHAENGSVFRAGKSSGANDVMISTFNTLTNAKSHSLRCIKLLN